MLIKKTPDCIAQTGVPRWTLAPMSILTYNGRATKITGGNSLINRMLLFCFALAASLHAEEYKIYGPSDGSTAKKIMSNRSAQAEQEALKERAKAEGWTFDVTDEPVEFFKGVVTLESGLIIPSPVLQDKLLKVIASPTYQQLHQRDYSVIANPYTLGRQNCTEFVLDVLNAAIYQTSDIQAIKAYEKAHFVAQPVHVNPFKLMLGAMLDAEVSLSDHRGLPVTATFERLADYLQTYDTGAVVKRVYSD
mgnify:CR=1 FL=1